MKSISFHLAVVFFTCFRTGKSYSSCFREESVFFPFSFHESWVNFSHILMRKCCINLVRFWVKSTNVGKIYYTQEIRVHRNIGKTKTRSVHLLGLVAGFKEAAGILPTMSKLWENPSQDEYFLLRPICQKVVYVMLKEPSSFLLSFSSFSIRGTSILNFSVIPHDNQVLKLTVPSVEKRTFLTA